MTVSKPDTNALLSLSDIRMIRWARQAPERGENSSSMALRYLRNAVAWNSAMEYIFNGVKISPSLKDITLDFVVSPIASPDTCAPEEAALTSGITYMLNKLSIDPQSEMAKSLTEEFRKKVLPIKFVGTVHCEASLMGMIVACKDEMIPLPDGMKHDQLEAFKVLPNCIYVPSPGSLTFMLGNCDGRGRWCNWCRKEVLLVLFLSRRRVSHGASLHIFPNTGISWSHFSMGVANHWNLPARCSIHGNRSDEDMGQGGGQICRGISRRPKKSLHSAMSSPAGSISEGVPDIHAEILPEPSSGM